MRQGNVSCGATHVAAMILTSGLAWVTFALCSGLRHLRGQGASTWELGRLIAALLSLFTAASAVASIDAPISLRELYRLSHVVAVVEIVDGRVVAAGGDGCGARYSGRVVEGTKNAKPGQLIEFGFRTQLKIGSRYLVLLDQYEDASFDRLPDFQERCRGVLPGLTLAALGRGAMEVIARGAEPASRDSWRVRRERLVEYPIGTRSQLVDGEKQLVFADMVERMKDSGPDTR